MMNLANTYLSRWPESSDTRRTMRTALDHVAAALAGKGAKAGSFAWESVRYEDAIKVSAKLLDKGYSIASVNKALVAFRGVLEVAWRTGAMDDEAYRRIKIESVRGTTLPAGKALDDKEQDKLEAALKKVPPRDAALVVALYACGLRRIEAVRLRREDYDPRRGLRALGKGNKERLVPMNEKWAPVFEKHWRTLGPGEHVFVSERNGVPQEDLSRDGLSFIVRQFCKEAGVEFRPHDLRRTFGTSLLANGVDLLTVKKLMGHASADTTSRYDMRDEAAAREAVKVLGKRGRPRGKK